MSLLLYACGFDHQAFASRHASLIVDIVSDPDSQFLRLRELAVDGYRRVGAVRELAGQCGGWSESSIIGQNQSHTDVEAIVFLTMLVVYQSCGFPDEPIAWKELTKAIELRFPSLSAKDLIRGHSMAELFVPSGNSDGERIREEFERYPYLGFSGFHLPGELDCLIEKLSECQESEDDKTAIHSLIDKIEKLESGLILICCG